MQYSLINFSRGLLRSSIAKMHSDQYNGKHGMNNKNKSFCIVTKINFNSNQLHYNALLIIQWKGQYNFLPS